MPIVATDDMKEVTKEKVMDALQLIRQAAGMPSSVAASSNI